MNKENLQKMADHIRTIPQDRFDMKRFRDVDYAIVECKSVGCVIGHCVHLAPELITRGKFGSIDFSDWSSLFTDTNLDESDWCFSSGWVNTDNTPSGAADRIEWLINNGLPENWKDQIWGDAPLCYKTETPK